MAGLGNGIDRRDAILGVALALIAGFVDAIGFTRLFEVFPANQSGNAVLLGVSIGDPSWEQAWRPGLSLITFAIGVGLGIAVGDHLTAGRRTPALLGIQGALLVVFAAVAGNLDGVVAPLGGTKEVVLLSVSSIAMGLQTDVIRRVSGVAVYTTFQTGTITRIADTASEELLHDGRAPAGAPRLLVVLIAIIGGYIGGSALGAAMIDGWGYALWVPAVGCIVLALLIGKPQRDRGLDV